MTPSRALILSFGLLPACIVDNPFSGASMGAASETSASELGDGDGDTLTGDGDGDTLTGDGDTLTGDGDGDTLTGDGDGDGKPACERLLWIYLFESLQWISVPIDEAWNTSFAPPCELEIAAASYFEDWDRLWVISSTGIIFRREGIVWQEPEDLTDRFPELAGRTIESMTSFPELGMSPARLEVYSPPDLLRYAAFMDGTTSFAASEPLQDVPVPGPAQTMLSRDWSMSLSNPPAMPEIWWVSWQGFSDGLVYRTDSSGGWASWSAEVSPLFTGQMNAPAPDAIEAAWGDFSLQQGYFIAR